MKNLIGELFHLFRSLRRAQREGRTAEFVRAAQENARIQQIMMRPMTHEVTNGSGELGWGTSMLCFALSSYATVILPKAAWRNGIGPALSFGLLACACVAMPFCRWVFKKYVTSPRTGYVSLQRGGAFWIAIVVSVVVAVPISLGLVHLMQPEMARNIAHSVQAQMHPSEPATPGTLTPIAKILLVGMGPLSALLYLMLNAVSIREHRWKWLLLLLLALGPLVICFLVPGNYIEVSRPVMLFVGLVCLISGGVTLVSFLRHHPAVDQPAAPEVA